MFSASRGKIVWTGRHDAAMLAVQEGRVDAAFTNGANMERAIAAGLVKKEWYNFLWWSDVIPRDPWCWRKNLKPELKEKIREAIFSFKSGEVKGADKFWKFHDLAFKNQEKLEKSSLEKYAKDSGADVKKFNECMDTKKFADYVQKDMEYGEKIGVKSTPTFFVNGQMLSGALPIESFSEVIDEELKTKKN